MRARERSLSAVPRRLFLALALAVTAQVVVGERRAEPDVSIAALPAAPSPAVLQVLAAGETSSFARLLMLWLQAFDYQPGVSVALRDLDYARLEEWLARIVGLDARFQYPFLAAARVYGEVADESRQRRMIDFIARHFEHDREQRWPWMAHAVYLAKHRLRDLDLALDLARRLARLPATGSIPSWVRQMHIFVLDDMGELESARVLLGGLLESGEITDPHEQWFLSRRLHDLEQRLAQERSADSLGGTSE